MPGDGTTVSNVFLMEMLSTFVVVLAQLMFLVHGERLSHDHSDGNSMHLTKHAQNRGGTRVCKDAAPFVLGLIVVVMTAISLSTSGASIIQSEALVSLLCLASGQIIGSTGQAVLGCIVSWDIVQISRGFCSSARRRGRRE